MRSFALKDYSQVIVDGSFFINRFPEELAQELIRSGYYTADSFHDECGAYLMHMTPDQRQVFTDNFGVLQKAAAKPLEHAQNLWHGLRYASRSGRPILVITSNLLLIEKIVLRELDLDIYNLHELQFMPRSKFGEYRKSYTFQKDCRAENAAELFDPKAEELNVYDETQWPQRLVRAGIVEGLEAYLYQDPDAPDLLAKLFTPSHRTDAKLKHVKALLALNRDRMHCTWAALPEQVCYDRNGNPLGFQMRRFDDLHTLWFGVEVEPTLEKKVATYLDWCVMLTTQIAYLGVFGIYVTDFSAQNFLVPSDDTQDRHIIMLDTDSFCMGTYFGARVDGAHDQWSILNVIQKPDVNKADLIDLSIRLLFAEVFYILTGSEYHAYQGTHHYAHDPVDGALEEDGFCRYIFPGEVLHLMDQVLKDPTKPRIVPSLDGLIRVLFQAQKSLSETEQDLTYQTLLERYNEGVSWPLNGLGGNYDVPIPPDPFIEEEEDRPKQEPAPGPGENGTHARKKPEQKPRKVHTVRRVDRRDPFTAPRLAGAIVEPEPVKVVPREPVRLVDRAEATKWKYEQQRDREKAPPLKNWFYRGLFLMLILLAVWLCFFADLSFLNQLRMTARDWLERVSEWYSEDIRPLLDGLWERIRGMLDQWRESGDPSAASFFTGSQIDNMILKGE